VRDAFSDLKVLVGKYRASNRSILAGRPSGESAREAEQAEETADLEYALTHVPAALERSLEGLDRVATIVASMKEFAHPDQRQMSAIDLNQAIRSTLTISLNEYKYVADVETDLRELPVVTCHPGEINQAILNIVVNAAHAISDVVGKDGRKGRIRVATRRDGDFAVLSISDTGGGIPVAIRDKIFEPFFTTKEVGRGTGQGLAIARSVVVDKHGGELTFETEAGRGTTFFVRIPIAGVRAAVHA
jgi:signal transduction histidine kinase